MTHNLERAMTKDSGSSQSAEEQAQQQLRSLLPAEILSTFEKSYTSFTKVQVLAGLKLLSHEDVVVESPTGSGKTFSYLLPALTIMRKQPKWKSHEMGLLVMCPSRDLARQVHDVAKPFCDALNYTVYAAIGGKKIDGDLATIRNGVNVLIASPGRLESLIDSDAKEGQLKRMLKTVEVLIVDEADKFIEITFSRSMNTILSYLPKQRRTGLFSATQVKDKVDLTPFALRSCSYVKITEKEKTICPSSLSVYYTTVNADDKLMTVVEFIRSIPESKVLVFLPSCQCVQYFTPILRQIFIAKRKVFSVHGKNKNGRYAQIDQFRKTKNSIMLCTDLMARGMDIADLDWVVHFDIPKKTSWLVHRAGRAGRNGREGASLLILTPAQSAYVTLMKEREKLEMKERKVKTVTPLKSEQLRLKIVEMASKDRELLEQGSSAFVSWIKAQTTHDSYIACKIKDVDFVGHAHAFGLLRLPKTKETLGAKTDHFKRSPIDTSTIPYRKKADEVKRLESREKGTNKRSMYKQKESSNPGMEASKKRALKKKKMELKKKTNTGKENVNGVKRKATSESTSDQPSKKVLKA